MARYISGGASLEIFKEVLLQTPVKDQKGNGLTQSWFIVRNLLTVTTCSCDLQTYS